MLVELQFRVILALIERELYLSGFILANPGGRVVQERGLSSIHYFMEANKDAFPSDAYSLITNLASELEKLEEGSHMCLLTMPKDRDDRLIDFVEGRGDDIPHQYLRDVASLYRDSADEFDEVWDPLDENTKQALIDCVESKLME